MTLIEIMSDVNAGLEIGGEKHLPHFERVMIVNVSGVVAFICDVICDRVSASVCFNRIYVVYQS